MQQINHIQQQRDKAERLKKQVIKLLRWTELEYAEFQLRIGRQYLQAYIPRDPDGIDELLKSRIFWNWWRNHWMLRDEQFLAVSNIKNILPLYLGIHNPEFLVKEIYPNGTVLSVSYAKMIGQVIEEIKTPQA